MTPDLWNPQPPPPAFGWRSFTPTTESERKWVERFAPGYDRRVTTRTTLVLCQVVIWVPNSGKEHLAGVFYWARGAVRQHERNQWIGWSPRSREMGISQVVELRQFISMESYFINMKREIMREALKALPDLWQKSFGVAPLLVEGFGGRTMFLDEDFKAMEWTPVSKPDHKNKFWLRPLIDSAREALSSHPRGRAEKACLVSAGFDNVYGRFDVAAIKDLVRRMAGIKDARRKHKNKLPLRSMLAVICLARLDGNYHPAKIGNWSRRLTPNQLRALGLGGLDSNKHVVVLSHDTMSRFIAYLVGRETDHKEAEEQFNGWLAERGMDPIRGRLCFDLSRKSRSPKGD